MNNNFMLKDFLEEAKILENKKQAKIENIKEFKIFISDYASCFLELIAWAICLILFINLF